MVILHVQQDTTDDFAIIDIFPSAGIALCGMGDPSLVNNNFTQVRNYKIDCSDITVKQCISTGRPMISIPANGITLVLTCTTRP